MKNEHTGLKSLLSVLSILIVFGLVCGGIIYTLVKTGAMNFGGEQGSTTSSSAASSKRDDEMLTDVKELGFGKSELQTVLLQTPFSDTYYARIYTTYVGRYGVEGTGANFKIEIYDIYKSAEKYKIITYNSGMTPQKYVICDGENVAVLDGEGVGKTYPVSETFSFVYQSPMPDFSIFETEKYEITSYSLSDGEYTVYCKFPDMGITDEIHIDEETGVVNYFRSAFGGKTFVEYSLFDFDREYPFSEDEFIVPTAE